MNNHTCTFCPVVAPLSSESKNEKYECGSDDHLKALLADINLAYDLVPYGFEVNKEKPSQGNVFKQGMEVPVDYEFDHDIMYHSDDDAIISGKKGDLETWMDDDSLVLSNANGKMIVGMRGVGVGACAGGMEAGSLGVKADYTTWNAVQELSGKGIFVYIILTTTPYVLKVSIRQLKNIKNLD